MFVVQTEFGIAAVENIVAVKYFCGVPKNMHLKKLIENNLVRLYSFNESVYLKNVSNEDIAQYNQVSILGHKYSKEAFFKMYKVHFFIGQAEDFLVLKYIDNNNLTQYAVLH